MPAVTDYCSLEDLGRFGTSEDALEPIPLETQGKAITAASRFIDSYLRTKFTLPLLAVGQDLARACAIIAVWDIIYGSRGAQPGEGEKPILQVRYDQIIKWLEMIAQGTVTPEVTDSTPGATPGVLPSGARVISSTMRGWSSRGTGRTRGPFEGD
jgi:phage gp36-like protein